MSRIEIKNMEQVTNQDGTKNRKAVMVQAQADAGFTQIAPGEAVSFLVSDANHLHIQEQELPDDEAKNDGTAPEIAEGDNNAGDAEGAAPAAAADNAESDDHTQGDDAKA